MIIVTGGAGFIGSALVWKLNQKGIKDIVVVEDVGTDHESFKNLQNLSYTEFINRKDFIKKLEVGEYTNITAILHMGACSSTLEQNTEYLKEINIDYSIRLAEWSKKNGVYFAYASSAATYGDGNLGFKDDPAMNNKYQPLNPYGWSKLKFDQWVQEQGLEGAFTGYRFFNVYGPNEYHKAGMRSMVKRGHEQAKETGVIKLFKSYKPEYPDGGQQRDFIYVKDIADIVVEFMLKNITAGIINVGTGKAATWNDLANSIWKALGKESSIEYIEMPDKLKEQYQYFTEADISKLKKLGYGDNFLSIEDGTRDYVQNYLESQSYL